MYKKKNVKFFFFNKGKPVAVKQLNSFMEGLKLSNSSSSGISNSSLRLSNVISVSTSNSVSLDHETLNSFSEFQREAWLMSGIDSKYLVQLQGFFFFFFFYTFFLKKKLTQRNCDRTIVIGDGISSIRITIPNDT